MMQEHQNISYCISQRKSPRNKRTFVSLPQDKPQQLQWYNLDLCWLKCWNRSSFPMSEDMGNGNRMQCALAPSVLALGLIQPPFAPVAASPSPIPLSLFPCTCLAWNSSCQVHAAPCAGMCRPAQAFLPACQTAMLSQSNMLASIDVTRNVPACMSDRIGP